MSVVCIMTSLQCKCYVCFCAYTTVWLQLLVSIPLSLIFSQVSTFLWPSMVSIDPGNIRLQDAIDATVAMSLRDLPDHVCVGPMPPGAITALELPAIARSRFKLCRPPPLRRQGVGHRAFSGGMAAYQNHCPRSCVELTANCDAVQGAPGL